MCQLTIDLKLPSGKDPFTFHWPKQFTWPCLTSKQDSGECTPKGKQKKRKLTICEKALTVKRKFEEISKVIVKSILSSLEAHSK